jgi:hypothetical protein
METIFDYNPTKAELKRFNLTTLESIESVKSLYAKDGDTDECCKDSILYQLGFLFVMRGNDKKANKYWEKMKDKRMLSTLVQDF